MMDYSHEDHSETFPVVGLELYSLNVVYYILWCNWVVHVGMPDNYFPL